MSTTITAGMTIEQEGEGRAIILLHGLGGSSNSFQPLVPALRGRRIIRPDLPGAGRSPTPRGKIDMRLLVDTLIRATFDLGVDSADLVGHSFGSLIAQHVAQARPALARTLTLFGPIIEPADAARERLKARAELARQQGMDTVADQVTSASTATGTADTNPAAYAFVRESHMRQSAEGFAKSCEALAEAGPADLKALTMPVLVVTGEEDAVGPPSTAHQLADGLRQGRAVILPQCGHWTPIEKPAECRRLLSEFVGGT
ncbi:alpha/beta fold hydrolase [Pseudohoeflea coraliihabitans]|uniref:Alpha/beta hydrolase n=1 Tax=Pseudohoeflea coraliihabitans TaxID=2860393 RepID=A0ABS6WNK6_9HYPH|nr:alpha/beta hydrolase [Pseudohoeflea sp. DP4N28-3]MBW3097547.1 alpha/beta hydrolase [Pseudohoeflea sp. DP4N28-3]